MSITTSLIIQSNINDEKLQVHLGFIDSFSYWCRAQNWRLVVYGGYGLDGYLQTITRNHGDVDLVLYGRLPRAQAIAQIVDYLHNAIKGVEVKSKDEDFLIDIKVKSPNISGNFYYVQTVEDPFINLNRVVKTDETIVTNTPTQFPPPVKGKLVDLSVEVQDQSAHLADIIRKRGSDITLSKHDQDIANIQALLAR